MKPEDLVFNIIYPACKQIDAVCPSSIALLAGTGAVESNVGEYLVQTTFKYGSDLHSFGGGLGPFQNQANDHDDAIKNFFPGNSQLAAKAHAWLGLFDATRMATDMIYAAMFCRIHYLRCKQPLPDPQDVLGLANYWKENYNSSLGAGTASRFVQCYPKVQAAVSELIAFMEK